MARSSPTSTLSTFVSAIRSAVRTALPPRALHAYRMLRHTVLFPFERELSVIPRFLSRDAVAVDVGANVGLVTDLMARSSRRVIAFEPHPGCAAHLRALRLGGADIVELALSDHGGESVLHVPVQQRFENHAMGTLEPAEGLKAVPGVVGMREHTVTVTTLDAALAGRLGPDETIGFIKIDVEGHELPALRGAERTLDRFRPELLVELEFRHSDRVGETFAFLARHGYGAHVLGESGDLVPVTADELRAMQSDERLAQKWRDRRYFGYVHNVFFLPEYRAAG
jgi:FkbM family methyltransferase